MAPRSRSRSLSCGRPASGPRAEWAGTTAPRSRGALRPAAPGAGGYKWSGGCSSRLSPPRVAAACAAFGLSKPEAKKRKSLKKIQKSSQNLKKKRKKEKGKKKAKEEKRKKNETASRAGSPRGSDFRTFPACLSVRVSPSGGEPPPALTARLRTPLRRVAAPRPGRPHHVSGCPSPAPAKIWFPPSRAAVIVNRREPGAYIYRETRVPKATVSAASVCLLGKKKFFFAPFAKGFPTLIFYF